MIKVLQFNISYGLQCEMTFNDGFCARDCNLTGSRKSVHYTDIGCKIVYLRNEYSNR